MKSQSTGISSGFRLFKNANFMSFLMNLLAVIIGIVLTFGITYLVEHIQERRKNEDVMLLVKQDLESSLESIQPFIDQFQVDSAIFTCVYNYRNHYDEMPVDTMILFVATWLADLPVMSENTISEVIKSSQIFEKMDDKQLVVQILTGQLYSTMAISTAEDVYRERDDIMESLYKNEKFPWKDALTPQTARIYFDYFLDQPPIYNNVMGPTIRFKLNIIRQCIASIQESVDKLEEMGY